MSAYTQLLVEKRQNVWEQAKALTDKAAEEKRELSGDEQQTYDRLNADLNELRNKADAVIAGEKVASEAEETLRKMVAASPAQAETATRNLDTEMRQMFRGDIKPMEIQVGLDQAMALYSKESRAAWLNEQQRTALNVGTGSAGGNLVPTAFYDTLVRHLIADSAIIAAGATVLHTGNGESIQIPTTTAYTTGTLTAEAAQLTESEPTFAQRTLGAFKYGAIMKATHELVEDSAFPIVPFLADQGSEGVVNSLGIDLVTGNGTSKPRGIVLDATSGVAGATGQVGVPTVDEMISLEYSVLAKYRRNAAWLMNDSTVGKLRQLKASTSGIYLWQPSLVAGTPDNFDGYPIHTDPNVAATALNAKSVLFGDFSKYFVRIVNTVRFERSDDFLFDTDVIAFRVVIRADGALIDRTGAVKYYAGGAS